MSFRVNKKIRDFINFIHTSFGNFDFPVKDLNNEILVYQKFFKNLSGLPLALKNTEIKNNVHKVEINLSYLQEDLKNGIVITTKRLYEIYKPFLSPNSLVLVDGERVKTKKHLFDIYDFLFNNGISPKDTVKIFGGGALSDLASFACSTFKRGVSYVIYPTTLLSQIDASIGGKNAINYKNVKNIIGLINMPKKVVINPLVLLTLSDKEHLNGLAEALKISIITGENIDIFENPEFLYSRGLKLLTKLIKDSVTAKLKIVERDRYDKGLRRVLNFGHTFGHIIEKTNNLPHGHSVLWGMDKELLLFLNEGLINEDFYLKVRGLIESLIGKNFLNKSIKNYDTFLIKNDKKAQKNIIVMPVIKNFGDFYFRTFNLDKISNFIKTLSK